MLESVSEPHIAGFFSQLFIDGIKLLALISPPGVLSAYLAHTDGYSRQKKRRIALKTGSAIFIIGLVLFLFGQHIFALFGFTLDAFRIGAGCLLFLNAVALINDHPSAASHIEEGEDISVVPLAIPLGMGPASISTVMLMGATCDGLEERLLGIGGLVLASLCVTIMLLMATSIARVLKKTGIAVMSKLTGLILAAIAAQVVFTGVQAFFPR